MQAVQLDMLSTLFRKGCWRPRPRFRRLLSAQRMTSNRPSAHSHSASQPRMQTSLPQQTHAVNTHVC